MALIANFALLLNMARRLSFSIAQPITIVGWYIASFLLIADISSVIHIVKVPDKRRALTQAFYYAIYSAALYFIIASLMLVTVYGAWKGHYSREFKLTMSQRTLMLQTISFMIWMLGGAAVYAKIEGWMFLDAVYFTNYTLLTVGIGDYAPNTHLGRSLLFPYAIGGIVILGLVISSIRTMVLERGKKKLGAREVEKLREGLLKQLHKRGETAKITPIEDQARETELAMTEYERRRQEFEMMREVQQRAENRRKWVSLCVSGTAWMFLWLIGAVVFWKAEHEQEFSYFEAVYFAYTTLLTIGYGDFKPFSNSGKSFFVFWSLMAVPTLTILISNMGDTVVKSIRDLTLYLGEFTFLPGDTGLRARLHQLITKGTAGKITPPSFLEPKTTQASNGQQQRGSQHKETSPDSEKSKNRPITSSSSSSTFPELLTSPHEHHHLLARELRSVMRHINEYPARKYTYEEWAWFLKLLGEDEKDSETHRKPTLPANADPNATIDSKKNENGKQEWSWLGDRSPLLEHGEAEAEWVLHRLGMRLENLLKRHVDRMATTTTTDNNKKNNSSNRR